MNKLPTKQGRAEGPKGSSNLCSNLLPVLEGKGQKWKLMALLSKLGDAQSSSMAETLIPLHLPFQNTLAQRGQSLPHSSHAQGFSRNSWSFTTESS